jgi:cytochrome c553
MRKGTAGLRKNLRFYGWGGWQWCRALGRRWGCGILVRRKLPALTLTVALFFPSFIFAESAAETYKKKCAACHGASGNGDTMIGKNLKIRPLRSSDVQRESDDELFTIISKGRSKMPAFDRKVSKEQIHELVKYIRSLK